MTRIPMHQIIARCTDHWFEPGAMRFFRTRLPHYGLPHQALPGRVWFATSERGPNGVRAFSLRTMGPDGCPETVGEFQAYARKHQAIAAMRAAIKAAVGKAA